MSAKHHSAAHDKTTMKTNHGLLNSLRDRGIQNPEFALHEYVRFLTLKIHANDYDANILSPCALVNEVWHLHLLDIQSYYECMSAIASGHFIRHDPDGALEEHTRYKRLLLAYKEFFGEEPGTHWREPKEGNVVWLTYADFQRRLVPGRQSTEIHVKTLSQSLCSWTCRRMETMCLS